MFTDSHFSLHNIYPEGSGKYKAEASLEGKGTLSIFNLSYSVQKKVSIDDEGDYYGSGLVLNYGLFAAGAEYSKFNDNYRVMAKLSMQLTPGNAASAMKK